MEENNGGKIRKVFINEAKTFWAVIVATAIIVFFIANIQKDIALIKENHAAHIEVIMREIEDLNKTDELSAQERKELMKYIIENNSKLDRLLGKFDLPIK